MTKQEKFKYNYLIQTDASVRGLKSVHSYNIRGLQKNGQGGKEFRSKAFGRLIDDPISAEIYALTEALQYMQEKGFYGSIVKTDSLRVVEMVKNRENNYSENKHGRDIVYLRKLLDMTKSKIIHGGRNSNKGADVQCQVAWEKKQFSLRGKKVGGFQNKGTTGKKIREYNKAKRKNRQITAQK
jgi:ribonuclease HI